jgi:parvulin-like peptidyl-prolyl isomerase
MIGRPMSTWMLLVLTVLAAGSCAPQETMEPSGSTPTVLATAEAAAADLEDPTAEAEVQPTEVMPLAARVDGRDLYLADYETQLAQYSASLQARGVDPNSPEGQENLTWAREWILNAMIEQVLIEQAAESEGVVVSEAELEAEMQAMVEENGGEQAFQEKLADLGLTLEESRVEQKSQMIGMRMMERVISSVPQTAEHVRARHIMVDTMEEAERLLVDLQSGADFVSVAKSYSQDASTRDSGGDLGFFPRGILLAPEVEQAAFALQPGQFTGVVVSSLGHHIVQVVERDPSREVSLENLRILQDRAVQEWIDALWAQADVEYLIDTAA